MKREYWINVYALPSGRNEMKVHTTKDDAENAASRLSIWNAIRPKSGKESRLIECIHVVEAETK